MKTVIFSGGGIQKGFFVNKAIESADSIIAADSGAESCLKFGVIPSVILGDFDSLKKQTKDIFKKKGSKFIQYPIVKNETDTEIALKYAINHGALEICILGGVEDNRIDHVLGNIFLSSYSLRGSKGQVEKYLDGSFRFVTLSQAIKIYFIDGNQKLWILKGPIEEKINGKKGDLLSLIPIGLDSKNIQTQGLEYPLNNEKLFVGKTRGISNLFLGSKVNVSFSKGILLFVQTHI
jgi:thiamine pyrophosphokinase